MLLFWFPFLQFYLPLRSFTLRCVYTRLPLYLIVVTVCLRLLLLLLPLRWLQLPVGLTVALLHTPLLLGSHFVTFVLRSFVAHTLLPLVGCVTFPGCLLPRCAFILRCWLVGYVCFTFILVVAFYVTFTFAFAPRCCHPPPTLRCPALPSSVAFAAFAFSFSFTRARLPLRLRCTFTFTPLPLRSLPFAVGLPFAFATRFAHLCLCSVYPPLQFFTVALPLPRFWLILLVKLPLPRTFTFPFCTDVTFCTVYVGYPQLPFTPHTQLRFQFVPPLPFARLLYVGFAPLYRICCLLVGWLHICLCVVTRVTVTAHVHAQLPLRALPLPVACLYTQFAGCTRTAFAFTGYVAFCVAFTRVLCRVTRLRLPCALVTFPRTRVVHVLPLLFSYLLLPVLLILHSFTPFAFWLQFYHVDFTLFTLIPTFTHTPFVGWLFYVYVVAVLTTPTHTFTFTFYSYSYVYTRLFVRYTLTFTVTLRCYCWLYPSLPFTFTFTF